MRLADRLVLLAALSVFGLVSVARADEGMWTYDNVPVAAIEKQHGFAPSPSWLEHLRLASVRINDGGSGSFVSPAGLILTNHHVALGCIQNLSSAEHDYVGQGFLAATRDEELACPGYEINVLLKIEDVTGKVQAAAPVGATPERASQAQRGEIARLETACARADSERCDVVNLYRGAQYHLYTYKKYSDVAPGLRAGAAGGLLRR